MSDLIEQLLTKHFEPLLSPLWDSVLFWRSVALFVIVLFLSLCLFKNRVVAYLRREQYHEHDRKVFQKLNSIINEQTFRDLCLGIRDFHFFDRDQIEMLHSLEDHGIRTENQFLTPSLHRAFSMFHNHLDQFSTCVATVFFYVSDTRSMLYPELRPYVEGADNPKRKIYLDAEDEIARRANDVLASYETYRNEVKKVLLL